MLGLGLRLGTGRRPFDPRRLFAGGVAGGWYDPGAPGATFADAGATVPAVADGPVARLADLSGQGNHLIQANAAARPLLRRDGSGRAWLELDGEDDFLPSAAPALRITGDLTAIVAVGRASDGRYDIWASAQTGAAQVNQYEIRTEPDGGLEFVASGLGEFEVDGGGPANRTPAGATRVLSVVRSGGRVRLDAGGGEVTAAHGTMPVADAQSEFRLGARKGSPLFARGRVHAALLIGRALSAAELRAAREFLAARAGVGRMA